MQHNLPTNERYFAAAMENTQSLTTILVLYIFKLISEGFFELLKIQILFLKALLFNMTHRSDVLEMTLLTRYIQHVIQCFIQCNLCDLTW